MNDACFCPSNGKIYGTSGPYVVQYNGTTGVRENYSRVGAPLYGDMRICYHAANDTLYVATQYQPNRQFFGTFFPTDDVPFREVFPVSTGLVVSAHIALGTIVENLPPYGGFQWIASAGDYLYVVYSQAGYSGLSRYNLLRVNPTNIADRSTSNTSPRFRPEHGALSPTQVALPNPTLAANNSQIRFAPINWDLSGDWDSAYVVPHNPCAVEFCAANSLFYAVCGDTNLLRIDTLAPFPGTFTTLNLGAVEASADPYRIRYWSGTGRLYLPCPTANGVIAWNPNTETGEFKSGFDNPIDVVFTSSKAFAVQNAQVGLREIT